MITLMAFWLKALPTTSTWSTLRTSREADSTLRNVLSRTSSLAESDTWRPKNSSKYILETEKENMETLMWKMCDCAVDKAQPLHLLDCHLQEKIERRETKIFQSKYNLYYKLLILHPKITFREA